MRLGPDREVRYDRILVLGAGHAAAGPEATARWVQEAQLLGTSQVGTTQAKPKGRDEEVEVPLFPSDHFGVFAKVAL